MDKYVDLVQFIAEKFVDDKAALSVTLEESDEKNKIVIMAAEDDMGKIIGKQGRIAKAIRTLVKAATTKESKKYFVDIRDAE